MSGQPRQVWKYPVVPGANSLNMPRGAQFLSAGHVEGEIVVWALVDPTAIDPTERRVLFAVATGADVDGAFIQRFVDRAIHPDGSVTHIFELAPDTLTCARL